MIVADLPPLEQDRIVCSISAAEAYAIPADIIQNQSTRIDLVITDICSLTLHIFPIYRKNTEKILNNWQVLRDVIHFSLPHGVLVII